MRIGILLTGHAPDAILPQTGDYDAMFRTLLAGHGFDFVTYAVVDGELPASATDADGWVITGSRHGAYEDHPWIPPLEALIREAYAAGIPLVGICFGHQIVAQALGGRVEPAAIGWIAGRQSYDWGGKTLALHAWHRDQVVSLPAGAQVLASGPGCPYAAVAYGPHMMTVQPHPEYDAEVIAGLIEHRGQALPQDRRDKAAQSLGPPVAKTELAAKLTAVLKGASHA